MKNECLNLINTKIENKDNNKSLTKNLREWRKARNITNADYLTFCSNIIEELLEPLYYKEDIPSVKNKIVHQYFNYIDEICTENDIVDAIQDIQVFCINETELMGYDNLKCNNEVFKEIDSRKQDPKQYLEWQELTPYGKWKKWAEQPKEELYTAKYEECKL